MRWQTWGRQHKCFSLCSYQVFLLWWTLSWTMRHFRSIQGPGRYTTSLQCAFVSVLDGFSSPLFLFGFYRFSLDFVCWFRTDYLVLTFVCLWPVGLFFLHEIIKPILVCMQRLVPWESESKPSSGGNNPQPSDGLKGFCSLMKPLTFESTLLKLSLSVSVDVLPSLNRIH